MPIYYEDLQPEELRKKIIEETQALMEIYHQQEQKLLTTLDHYHQHQKGGNVSMQQQPQQQKHDEFLFWLRQRWNVMVLLIAFGVLLEVFTNVAGLPPSSTDTLRLVAGLVLLFTQVMFNIWMVLEIRRLMMSRNQTTSLLTIALFCTAMASSCALLGINPWYTGPRPSPPNSDFFLFDVCAFMFALIAVSAFVKLIPQVKMTGAKQLLQELFTRKNVVALLFGALGVVIASLIQLLFTWLTTGKP